MSEFQTSNFKKAQGGSAPNIVGKVEFTSPYFFVPPSGTTAERPASCAPGTIRFNTDVGTIEVYRGDTIGWEYIERREDQYLGGAKVTNPSSTAFKGSNNGTGTRGLFAGGLSSPSNMDDISFITISTMGDAQDFGNLSQARYKLYDSGLASRTRGLWGGGYTQPGQNRDTIDFVTFATTGDATDFGNLLETQQEPTGLSNATRGVWMNGAPHYDRIQYVTISTTGDSINFGDAATNAGARGGLASTTRGVVGGGETSVSPYPYTNTIEFITIASTGDATDFGDLTSIRRFTSGGGNATRGIFASGYDNAPAGTNVIDFITIASTGNATDFGDMTVIASYTGGSASSPTRMCVYDASSPSVKTIEKIEIATTGNGVDFGDTVVSHYAAGGGCSNGHGGL